MADTTVIGNINEPELKFTPNGKPVLNFSLAENHSKKDQQGQWQDDGTTWRKVAVWDKKAEVLAEALRKGDRVIVTGAERIREFELRDGGKGQSLELNAREVGIVPRAPKQEQAGFQQNQSQGQTWGQEHQSQGQQEPWAGSNAQGGSEPPF